MYNGIGLMTPRGSGTSGYVMKNLSHMKKIKNRDQFLKELQSMKDNVIVARKEANPEILLHEQKRDIEVKKIELREELESRGCTEDEINERVNRLEKKLLEKIEQGVFNLENMKDTHALTKQKELQEKKFNDAFGVKAGEFKPGSAFDFDTQDKEKLEKNYLREKKKQEQLLRRRDEKKAEKKKLKALRKSQEIAQKQISEGMKDNAHKKDKKAKKDKK